MAMATGTRLLLRSFRRLPPPPLRPPASPSPASLLLHRSPPPQIRQPSALLPSIRWFQGQPNKYSSSTAAPSRRGMLVDMLCFVSASAAVALDGLEDVPRPRSVSTDATATLLLDWDDGYRDCPPTRPRVEWEKRPITDALIALNLLVHGVDVLTRRKLIAWGDKNNDLIRKGQLWRLATSSLRRCGFIHITLNMFALDDIGSLMEEVTGPGRFLAIYCTSALAGSLMSYRFVPGNSDGASDAIFGLAFSLALRLFKVHVDNWAHLGGFLGGAAVELVLGPHEKQHVARIETMTLEDKESELFA